MVGSGHFSRLGRVTLNTLEAEKSIMSRYILSLFIYTVCSIQKLFVMNILNLTIYHTIIFNYLCLSLNYICIYVLQITLQNCLQLVRVFNADYKLLNCDQTYVNQYQRCLISMLQVESTALQMQHSIQCQAWSRVASQNNDCSLTKSVQNPAQERFYALSG